MQQIQIFEYVTARAAHGECFPESLLREGQGMRDAVLEDFQKLPATRVELLTEIPSRIDADWTLVIAPETEGILTDLASEVLRAGGRLLGPSPEAIGLTSDKLRLATHLQELGIPTPETALYEANGFPFPQVWKPRDGAGSQQTFLVLNSEAAELLARNISTPMIVQPYRTGVPASVSFLLGSGLVQPLAPCYQSIEIEASGAIHYRGGSYPMKKELAARAVEIASRAVHSVPGLFGYVGVDLVLGERDDLVIEINPRLTTSYLLLRQVCRNNLAQVMLQVAMGVGSPLEWEETQKELALN